MSQQGMILVDIPGGQTTDTAFLEGLGHPVEVCHGPEPKTVCPILSGEGCPLAENAHGIVFLLDLDRPQHRAILRKYKEALPDDVPIRVRVSADQAEEHRELLGGLQLWTENPAIGDLDGFAAEVEAADMFKD